MGTNVFYLDAFFLAGKSGDKPNSSGSILPYTFAGRFYAYNDQSSPKLKSSFDGTKDIVLRLPNDLNVSDMKWFSVWCREYDVVLGELKLNAPKPVKNPAVSPLLNLHYANQQYVWRSSLYQPAWPVVYL